MYIPIGCRARTRTPGKPGKEVRGRGMAPTHPDRVSYLAWRRFSHATCSIVTDTVGTHCGKGAGERAESPVVRIAGELGMYFGLAPPNTGGFDVHVRPAQGKPLPRLRLVPPCGKQGLRTHLTPFPSPQSSISPTSRPSVAGTKRRLANKSSSFCRRLRGQGSGPAWAAKEVASTLAPVSRAHATLRATDRRDRGCARHNDRKRGNVPDRLP